MDYYQIVEMTARLMKVPKNRQARMSDDIWMGCQALAKCLGLSGPRDGMEMAIRNYLLQMREKNADFAEAWKKQIEEGVSDD